MATRKTVFCDTNILLDMLDPSRMAHGDAVALLWCATEREKSIRLVAPITSFKDAHYKLCRLYRDERAARDSIAGLMGRFVEPVDMLASFGQVALESDEPDFEAALIRTCAEREGASVIITSDASAFEHSTLPTMTAAAFLTAEHFDYAEIDF